MAYIAVGKNRQRIYRDNSVFLDNGSEFTIELHNPTPKVVGAKIRINGTLMSSSILVIRPGERHFLERFIDTNAKLTFNTYTAEGSAEQVKAATISNGLVTVEFFNEIEQITPIVTLPYIPYHQNYFFGTCGGTATLDSLNSSNVTYTAGTNFTTVADTNSINYSSSIGSGNDVLRSSKVRSKSAISGQGMKSLEEVKVETGRVEKGSASAQSFDSYSGTFALAPVAISQYKIQPASQRPVEASEVRAFCTKCNTRKKKSNWTFCPSCGEKY